MEWVMIHREPRCRQTLAAQIDGSGVIVNNIHMNDDCEALTESSVFIRGAVLVKNNYGDWVVVDSDQAQQI